MHHPRRPGEVDSLGSQISVVERYVSFMEISQTCENVTPDTSASKLSV